MAFDPLHTHSAITLSNNNRTATLTGTNGVLGARSVLSAATKRYAELLVVEGATSPYLGVGVTSADYAVQANSWANSWVYYQQNGHKYLGDSDQGAYGASWETNGTVIGIAYDPVAGKLWFSKNGVWQADGDPAAGTNPAFSAVPSGLYLVTTLYRGDSPRDQVTGCFEPAQLTYPIPAGFQAWNLVLGAIAGNVIVAGNGGADQVVIRDWTTRELAKIVVPASNGDWEAEVPEGQYDLTYFAANCQPVCHGPYTVTAG